jgi:GNAT superfamily N-acetyltransferase
VSGYTVDRAGSDDIDAFVASVEGLFREDGGRHDSSIDVAWPTREGASYYAGLLDDPDCLLAVARREKDVVGHLVGKLVGPDALRLVRFAVLESMRVRPDLRGHGIGALLVEEFVQWARRSGAEVASVTAYAANDGAQRFYASHGFAPMSVTMRMAP